MRIRVLFESDVEGRPHGASYIRLLLPLGHPGFGPAEVRFEKEYAPCDVLVVDRTWTPWLTLARAEMLVREARRDGCRILYAIDDNLLDFDRYNLHRRHFSEEQLGCVRLLAREADVVVTSTPYLRDRLLPLNPRVEVVPNALDERLFPAELSPASDWSHKVTCGYMGTFTHEADLYLILEPLRRFLYERRERVSFQILGISASAGLELAFRGLPVQFLRTSGDSEYPDFVRWMREQVRWDFGLAPLQDNPFTRCKSDIKYLDYGLLGLPGVFSDVPAYAHTIRHGENGLLAGSGEAWYEQLCRLADDAELRARLRQAAFREISGGRTLRTCAARWREVIEQVAAQESKRP